MEEYRHLIESENKETCIGSKNYGPLSDKYNKPWHKWHLVYAMVIYG